MNILHQQESQSNSATTLEMMKLMNAAMAGGYNYPMEDAVSNARQVVSRGFSLELVYALLEVEDAVSSDFWAALRRFYDYQRGKDTMSRSSVLSFNTSFSPRAESVASSSRLPSEGSSFAPSRTVSPQVVTRRTEFVDEEEKEKESPRSDAKGMEEEVQPQPQPQPQPRPQREPAPAPAPAPEAEAERARPTEEKEAPASPWLKANVNGKTKTKAKVNKTQTPSKPRRKVQFSRSRRYGDLEYYGWVIALNEDGSGWIEMQGSKQMPFMSSGGLRQDDKVGFKIRENFDGSGEICVKVRVLPEEEIERKFVTDRSNARWRWSYGNISEKPRRGGGVIHYGQEQLTFDLDEVIRPQNTATWLKRFKPSTCVFWQDQWTKKVVEVKICDDARKGSKLDGVILRNLGGEASEERWSNYIMGTWLSHRNASCVELRNPSSFYNGQRDVDWIIEKSEEVMNALANTSGGRLFIGVRNDCKIVGCHDMTREKRDMIKRVLSDLIGGWYRVPADWDTQEERVCLGKDWFRWVPLIDRRGFKLADAGVIVMTIQQQTRKGTKWACSSGQCKVKTGGGVRTWRPRS